MTVIYLKRRSKRWITADTAKLKELHKLGNTPREISERMGFSKDAVLKKHAELGLEPHAVTNAEKAAKAREERRKKELEGVPVVAKRKPPVQPNASTQHAETSALRARLPDSQTMQDMWRVTFGKRLKEHHVFGYVLDGRPVQLRDLMRKMNAVRKRCGLSQFDGNPDWRV